MEWHGKPEDGKEATTVMIRYRKAFDSAWMTRNVPYSNGTAIIGQLNGDATYEFQVFIVYKDGDKGMPISAGQSKCFWCFYFYCFIFLSLLSYPGDFGGNAHRGTR